MRRRKKKRGFFIAGLVVCILVIYGGIELWQGLFGNTVEADSADEWKDWDLAKMVAPTLTPSTKGFTITTARTTFYDVYSDNQVWSTTNKTYRAAADLKPIEDGNADAGLAGGNTFTHFNYELSHSKNANGVEYQYMYDKNASSKVYPLYCGIAWPATQGEDSRWGTWSKTSGVYDGYTYNGVTHGWWFAAANTNQFDNKDKKISNEGTPGETQGGATQGLVNRELDENGNITIGHGDAMRVLPYFDSEYLETPYREGKVAKGHVVSNIAFPFRKGDGTTRQYMSESDKSSQTKTSDKYYYFDSYLDTIQLNEGDNNVTYYHGASNNNVKDTDGKNGFFPFNTTLDSNSKSLNYVFGVKMDLSFNMTSNGKIKGDDIIFEFTGDDDLWVFVDGYLVLDIGGAHIPCHGSINFASKKAVVDKVKKSDAFKDTYRDGEYGTWDSNKTYYFGKNNATDDNGKKLAELLSDTTRNHTLTIFYMERGKGNSNLKIKFNLPQITTLSVGDEVDAGNVNKSLQTEELWKACNQHYFKYLLENKGTKAEDYNNSITTAKTPASRTSFQPVGLTSTYRKSLTSEDSAVQRLRFYTFTGTNYFSMVVGGTNVTLPTLVGTDENGNGSAILDSEGCAEIDGIKYVFLGWTKDKTYHDNWKKIQDGTYIGGIPKLESAAQITVTESMDYYAVWAKKDVTVSYYDETGVDRPLGYGQSMDSPAVLIGEDTISRTKNNNRISFWEDSTLKDKNWKTDETRKGFKLNGWRLDRTEEEGNNPLVSLDFIPLCDVKLYADWSRTHYRAVFLVENGADQIKDSSDMIGNASGSWESNIIYFPIGYSGYLPFMNDSSSVSDFKETVSGGIDAYEFTSVPIRENYAIIKWAQNDADSSSYRTINYTDSNGKTLYKQEWTLGNEDVVFTGTWKKFTNTITFSPGSKGGTALDWGDKKRKYTIGSSIGKPEASNVWEDKDTSDGWEIIGWKDNHSNTITFPYTITENDEIWTAEWKKTSSTVTYEFADDSKGITGTTKDGETSCTKHYKVGDNIEILTLEALGTSAPFDSKGTKEGITYYVKGSDNHAYVITGWKDSDGNKVSASAQVTEDNCSLTAIWEKVTTKVIVTVTVPQNDIEEWNSNNAKGNGWVEKKAGSDTVWTLTLELNPGEKFADYFTKGSGTLYDKLYGADNPIGTNDLKHFKELSYETVVYAGGNISLSDANAVVPYTAGNHTANVTGIWTQKKIVTTFASVVPGADNDSSSPVVLGYMIYDVGNQEVSLPTADQTLLDSAGGGVGIVKPEGYSLSGWKQSPDAAGEGVVTFVPEIGKHNSTWYAVWKKNASQVTASRLKTENSQNSTRTVSRSKWRTFSFSSPDNYEKVAGELYELNDLLTKEEGTTGTTGTDGGFYLTYDQAASFLNCFTVGSQMHLEEVSAIYDRNGTESYNEAAFRNMYTTTWELRDIFGYISSRIDNSDLKDMGMLLSGNTIVYDGRVKEKPMEVFQFHNENDATGSGYATNVRALFTHSIKTGDITITKKLTSAAASVAKRKGDTEQEFAFKVSFYHIFGDTSDTEKRLYTGEYKKLDKYGNYVRDEADQIITYSAKDGKVKIKNGETAIITGIPVLTEYEITEEDSVRKSGTYLLSGTKEITAKGLAGKEKKYAVSDETVAEVQSYLEKYTDGGGELYSKSLIDNSTVLEGKKLQDLSDSGIDASIHRSFTGKVSTSGYTYNYVATNEVLINGVSLYMDKIIDEFYYSDNDRFTEDITYEELTDAKQTFVFNIRYTAVDDTGSVTGNPVDYQEKLTFDPTDSTIEKVNLPSALQTEEKKKGYKKSGIVIGLEPRYYEVREDENWSWKYDLMGIYYTPYGNDGSTLNEVYETNEHQKSVADKNKAGTEYPKVYRFYIRGKSDSASGTTIEKGGVSYRILDNVEDPTVTFVNMKAEDGRENIAGDTEIAVNRILLPTPTPNPNEYTGIAIDDAQKNQTLIKAETCILPNVKAEKADGIGTITDISNDNTNLTWSILSGSESVSLTGTTLTANAAGTAEVQAAYLDADGTTEHTATMTITVVEAAEFALKEGSTGQSGSYLVQCKTGCSGSGTNDTSDKAIDGNESTMWIANNGTWGETIYWGLLFKDDAGTDYCNRKICKVTLCFEPKNCSRTIVLYGVSGDSLTESTSALTQLGEKTLGANETELEFDISIGSYKGIKAVMKSCTGTAAPWPAIAEVKIIGY